MIAIDKDVPMPVAKPTGTTRIYPFAEMAIGDSFVFPDYVRFPAETARAATRKHRPKQFMTRRVKGGGVRCWRVV